MPIELDTLVQKFFETSDGFYKKLGDEFFVIDRGENYNIPTASFSETFNDFNDRDKRGGIKTPEIIPNIQEGLRNTGLNSFEKLTDWGDNAYIMRGFGENYPQGIVVRVVREEKENPRPESDNMLQPYETLYFDAEGKHVGTSTQNGIKVEFLPEVVSFEKVINKMREQRAPEEQLVELRDELRNRYNVSCIEEGFTDTDVGGVDNLCITPDRKIKNLDGDGLIKIGELKDRKAVSIISAYQEMGIVFADKKLEELKTTPLREFLKNADNLFDIKTAFILSPETTAKYSVTSNKNAI